MKNTFEEWFQMIQGLSVPNEVYDAIRSQVSLNEPTRLLQRRIRDILFAMGMPDTDASYILDHLRGYHMEPLDFVISNQVLAAYDELHQLLGTQLLHSFPYVYVLHRILRELGYEHIVQDMRMAPERKEEFDVRWQRLKIHGKEDGQGWC